MTSQLSNAASPVGTDGRPWWRDAVFYQLYLRSFADGDGDGVGDLRGALERLPYLAELGVDAVWVNPFYVSPMADHGYDVADHCDVDPMFGTLADFDQMLAEAHRLGLRVVIDVIPNQSSDEHPWFRRALEDPSSPYRDRYLFRAVGASGELPNNWESVFGGPAWTRVRGTSYAYLHLFDERQPDFNWRHPAVAEEFERILHFWLARGVDGFRIDVAHGLFKHPELPDHDLVDGEMPAVVDLVHCWDQPETREVYQRWRTLLDTYGDTVMVGEVFLLDIARVGRYTGPDRMHQAFNFLVPSLPFDADAFQQVIRQSLETFDSPTWVLSNHDIVRHVSRYGGGDLGRRRALAVAALLFSLPGSPYVYQGDELGLEESVVPEERRQDPMWLRGGKQCRDGCRTPMPWSSAAPGHGFSDVDPWLPFDAQAPLRSVERLDGSGSSTLGFYRRALALRREIRPELAPGAEVSLAAPGVVAVRRGLGAEVLHVLANFTARDVVVPFHRGSVEILSSGEVSRAQAGGLLVPGETTVWLRGSI